MAILKIFLLSVLIFIGTLNETYLTLQQKIIDGEANQKFELKTKEADSKTHTKNSMNEKVSGIILPHHLLVGSFIDHYFSELSQRNSYDTIFLISPNHFGYGHHYIQTTNQHNIQSFNLNLNHPLIEDLIQEKVVYLEPKHFPKEHGITVHIDYLNKYFPQAKIIPIIIKNKTPEENLNGLIEQLVKHSQNSKTLFIASIDFSHYTAEEFASKNDERTIKWLKNLPSNQPENFYQETQQIGKSFDQWSKDSVGIDSPESIYLLGSIMKNLNTTNFTLLQRTSSASLLGITDPEQNTSHIFGIFSQREK